MIPNYAGAQAQKMASTSSIPAGGYVAKIEGARVEDYSWGSVLVLAFDIAEGEYQGHFRKQFEDNTNPNRKWKGTNRLTIPNESSQYFANEKRTFNNFIYSLEQSNPNYNFDWDETHLKGKFIGVLFRNKEFIAQDGNKVMTTECGGTTDVQSIRDGSFSPLKDKLLKEETTPSTTSGSSLDSITDEDLPFN